jgi:hypothetical protein
MTLMLGLGVALVFVTGDSRVLLLKPALFVGIASAFLLRQSSFKAVYDDRRAADGHQGRQET